MLYTIEILNEIDAGTAFYEVGQYDVTKSDLIEITGETEEDFNAQFCNRRGAISKEMFNAMQVDLYII